MSNSSLVNYTKLSPNHSGQRKMNIDRITPHCVVGQVSVERLGDIFMPKSKDASCNYGIGEDGRVLLCVEEKNASWCSSSAENDQRAVTIECASDSTHPYAFKSVVYDKLVLLCADICKRNGKKRLLWLGDKTKTLDYKPKSDEMILTVHRWFATKACPGDWMYSRMGQLAESVNKLLNEGLPTDIAEKTEKPQNEAHSEWSGDYPKLPSRGYYQKGDGYEKYTNMKSNIRLIQEYLNWAIDAGLDVDGEYGSKTTAAVKDFQKRAGITVDGKFGKDTLAAAKDYIKPTDAKPHETASSNTNPNETASSNTNPNKTASNSKDDDTVKATEAAKSFDEKYAKTYIVNSKNGLNIRAGAGVDKKILVAVPYGQKLDCYGYYTDREGLRWLYIVTEYNGNKYTGFVSSVWVK